jgi:hypothetical protein
VSFILAWTGIGSFQFAATYGWWYEHVIFVGGLGALLAVAALFTAHRVAAWRRPTRAVSSTLCLLTVAAIAATGAFAGARTNEQDRHPAASGWHGQSGAVADSSGYCT